MQLAFDFGRATIEHRQLHLRLDDLRLSIRQLYEEDQGDRAAYAGGRLSGSLLDSRDDRRALVLRSLLRQQGGYLSPRDCYRAAVILQHGRPIAAINRARHLALRAASGGVPEARHLAAATLDRRLMYQGRSQKYGTQYRRINGRWQLWPVRPNTTDGQRACWSVPDLREAEAFARTL